MGASPPCSAREATRNVEPLEGLPDANDPVVSWQAGLDEIDAFFASCRTTPRTSADRDDHGNMAAKDGGPDGLLTSDHGFADGTKDSSSSREPSLTMPHSEHHDGGQQVQTEPLYSTTGRVPSHQRTLLNTSDDPGSSTPNSPAEDMANVVASASTVHVKAESPAHSPTHPPSADDAECESQPLRGDAPESPGSPMDLATPAPSPRPPTPDMATPPQPATSVVSPEVQQQSSAGKTSLFDEMRGEDSDAATARCTSESDCTTKPPVACSMTRKLSAMKDLLHDHPKLDAPTSVAPEETPSATVTASQSRKKSAATDARNYESMAKKRARSPSPANAAPSAAAPSTAAAAAAAVHATDMPMEGVERTDADVAPFPPHSEPPNDPSHPALHGPSMSADDAECESQPLRGDAPESPGSPMDLATPAPSPRPPTPDMATPPQPATSVVSPEVQQQSSAGKTSLFDEMRGEDSDAATARCTSESDCTTKPPVACSMTRKLSAMKDLLHDHPKLDAPTSVAPEETPSATVTASQSRKKSAATDARNYESMAKKRARSPSPANAAPSAAAPSTAAAAAAAVHATDMPMEGVERTDADVAPFRPHSEPHNDPPPPALHGPSMSAEHDDDDDDDQTISAADSDHDEDPAPPPPTKKPKRTRTSTSTLANELKALQRAPAGGPAAKSTRKLDPAVLSSSSTKAKAKAKKARPLSPRRTRAQQRAAAAPVEPSGAAAAAKRRHRTKG
nr:hypothetical protein CFP56_21275 [Quercus suber]